MGRIGSLRGRGCGFASFSSLFGGGVTSSFGVQLAGGKRVKERRREGVMLIVDRLGLSDFLREKLAERLQAEEAKLKK